MNTHTLLIRTLAAVAALIITSRAAAEAGGTMLWGLCGSSIAQDAGHKGRETRYKAAVRVSGDNAGRLKGNSVMSVLVGTGADECRDATVFLTYSLDGEPFYTQEAELAPGRWNSVELTAPYTIEGREFYIGYSLTAGRTAVYTAKPIGLDAGPANPDADLMAIEEGGTYTWRHVRDIYGDGCDANICLQAVLAGETLPQLDLRLTEMNTGGYARPGEPFRISGKVRNHAAATVKSFDVVWSVDGEETGTASFRCDMANLGETAFSVDDIVINDEGSHTVAMTVTAPNGGEDEDMSDNTLRRTVLCTTKAAGKKILIENFTTAGCHNCPAAHDMLEKVTRGNGEAVIVSHHAGFGTDIYTTPADNSYLWFYNSPSTYAPAFMVDRTTVSGNTPVMQFTGEQALRAITDYFLNTPAFVSIGIDNRYDNDTRKLEVTVTARAYEGFDPGGGKRLTVLTVEDGLSSPQSGASDDYVHNHVMRKALSTTWGDMVTFTGGVARLTYTTDIPSDQNPDKMKVVAFLSDYTPDDPNSCTVYNTEEASVTEGAVSGIDITAECDDITVSPATGGVSIGGHCDEAVVYGTGGQTVVRTCGGGFIRLKSGVYIVRTRSGNITGAQKVIVE